MTGYGMREQQRLLGDDTGEVRDKRKKAMHHDKNKDQQRLLCAFAERRANKLTKDEISTVGNWKLSGRRAQDKEIFRSRSRMRIGSLLGSPGRS